MSKAISEDIIINQGRVKDKDAIELHVETAGTLNKLIAPSKKYQITNLILTGNLNIIELVDKSLEVATPCGIAVGVVCL